MANVVKAGRGTLQYNKSFKRVGLKSYARALRRYGFTPTVDGPYTCGNRIHQQGKFGTNIGGRVHVKQSILQKKDATGQAGDLPADDVESNSEYLVSVGIGTPSQNLNLDFDTGSSDLWVFSTELPSSVSTTGHNVFDSSKSSTFKSSEGSTWQISYGDGSSASGNVGTDVLNLGGLVVQNQAIELAQQLSTQFAQGQGDGLLGLAFGSINTVKPSPVATPVQNLIQEGKVPQGSGFFTAYLANESGNSFYTFGFIDETAAGGQTPTYTPVDNSQGFWMFDSTSGSVNGQAISRTGNKAIADTGTTLCLIDDTTLQTIYKQIPGAKLDQQQQGWVIPTSTSVDSLPTVELAVGDKLIQLNKEDLMFQDLGNGSTYGGLQSRGSNGFDIYGDVFLRSIYAVFDLGNQRFGCIQRTATTGSNSKGSGQTAPASGSGHHAK